MSNAFNLSQLANFVDTSGKLNVSTGSTGTLPTTQGGTGLTTVGTNGQVLQSNGTSLTWATPAGGGVTSVNGLTGAVDMTAQYSIGSYVIGRPANFTTSYNNTTIAGSSLYAVSSNCNYSNGEGGAVWRAGAIGNAGNIDNSVASLVNTGSWRCVSIAYGTNGGGWGVPGLWIRYA